MAKKYLYHGTDSKSAQSIINDGIDLNKSRTGLDFGQGFYLTPNKGQAREWSLRKGGLKNANVLRFYVDEDKWKNLVRKNYNTSTEEWGNVIFF